MNDDEQKSKEAQQPIEVPKETIEPIQEPIKSKEIAPEEEPREADPQKLDQLIDSEMASEVPPSHNPSEQSKEPTKQDRKNLGKIKKHLKSKKKPQVEDEPEASWKHRCAICFERINERAKPNSCIHTFCMDCILGWTKFHNVCPLCKVEIEFLEKYDSVDQNKVIESIKIEKPPAAQEISEGLDNGQLFAEVCYICKSNEREEEQIVCEMCDYEIVHYTCIGHEKIPEEEWFCPGCKKEFEKRQREDSKKRKLLKAGKQIFKITKGHSKKLQKNNSNSDEEMVFDKDSQETEIYKRKTRGDSKKTKQEEVVRPGRRTVSDEQHPKEEKKKSESEDAPW